MLLLIRILANSILRFHITGPGTRLNLRSKIKSINHQSIMMMTYHHISWPHLWLLNASPVGARLPASDLRVLMGSYKRRPYASRNSCFELFFFSLFLSLLVAVTLTDPLGLCTDILHSLTSGTIVIIRLGPVLDFPL